MTPCVAILAPGAMGAGIGARLVAGGLDVVTDLSGRSAASRARAAAAGMRDVGRDGCAAARVILSVLPPDQAPALAASLAPVLTAAVDKPIYVDCNAISPETTRAIAEVIAATGAEFVDGGLIGGPPSARNAGAKLYLSGPAAPRLMWLADHGLRLGCLDAPVGAASALKLSYAGITKGLTGLGSAMLMAASRAGVADALIAELAASQPERLRGFRTGIPGMFPKAYRWAPEMQEIAAFAAETAGAEAIYRGLAELYASLADEAGQAALAALVERFPKE